MWIDYDYPAPSAKKRRTFSEWPMFFFSPLLLVPAVFFGVLIPNAGNFDFGTIISYSLGMVLASVTAYALIRATRKRT